MMSHELEGVAVGLTEAERTFHKYANASEEEQEAVAARLEEKEGGREIAAELRERWAQRAKVAALRKRDAADAKEKEAEAAVRVKPVAKPKPVAVPMPSAWPEVPNGASALEALTYVPGVVGELVEWIAGGARRPNRMMALGAATIVVGTLIGRRIMGPTESATHLYIINLAPTGYGKDWPLQCGVKVMDVIGAGDLLGPQEFASSVGVWKRLKRNPLMACFMDELGDELSLLNSNGNEHVTKTIGTLKKCYNAFATVFTAEKSHEESERLDWPAPSILGAATPERFFQSLKPRDLESGFANRLLILPFDGCRRPPENLKVGAGEPPAELCEALKKLLRREAILDRPDRFFDPKQDKREAIGWGPGAEEVYVTFSRKMDQLEGTANYELSMRACENAARLATIVAVGRGSKTVDRDDIAWAIRVAERSLDAACGGVAKYMREYFELPKFVERVLTNIIEAGGWQSRRNLARAFRSNQKSGFEFDKAVQQLLAEERIRLDHANGSGRGPPVLGYRVIEE